MNNLEQKIEAILFISGDPINIKKLAKLSEAVEKDVAEALSSLKEKYSSPSCGIYIIEHGSDFQLVTKPEISPIIKKIVKEETNEILTPAILETLSLVTYLGPISKSSLEYIRGVNSSFTLRSLLIRGLAERIPHPEKKNSFLYRPTSDLLKFLGVSSKEDLPEFKKYQELKETIENE
ncbi:MAG: SMC-Scp complex subunit ScpB [Candidatus Colwellbacteria bacterium]|jgi:segregation and condensation protein B|nr:SMC-Scp complex subunit ScpB [Candidatus Colwellbacteria bacterium]MCK9497284.1 SMC-Scp complex subunit ScpB [Candidatus Colwellbacteria bacterium]MDD3752641.1 SMC-Scp complex subunit ScpB [Candidatus Colwellbacteria bacterium]MDD4818716.1 SMC-Scp complex subunit ScpB [Candidatus Colwellbacteria bacterium]